MSNLLRPATRPAVSLHGSHQMLRRKFLSQVEWVAHNLVHFPLRLIGFRKTEIKDDQMEAFLL